MLVLSQLSYTPTMTYERLLVIVALGIVQRPLIIFLKIELLRGLSKAQMGSKNMRYLKIGLFAVFFSLSGVAHAKDLASRLGVGFANQFGLTEDLPSLAMRYYPNQDYGLMGVLGIDSEKDNARFGLQAKILKLVFKEDNLNFYTGAGAGIVSREVNGRTDSGFDLSGFLGAEFFFAGLENLGLNFEAGAGVTSVSSEVRFRTIGDHPLRAGFFFYF